MPVSLSFKSARNLQQADLDLQLAHDMARFYDDMLGFVMYAYDWRNDPTLHVVKLLPPYCYLYDAEFGPDVWACEVMIEVGNEVRARGFNGTDPVDAIREAIASGHGIGKSAFVAWLVDWIMSTRPHANGVVTANTAPQLESKTWAEIAKWTGKCITGHWFDVTTGRGAMRMRHKQHPDSWKCVAQTCDETNSEAFAGLHAAGSSPFVIMDESSAVPDKISEVAEGGMTDGEPFFFKFGNPTRNTGAFKDCFGKMRHRWKTRQIDSREVQVTNKSQINKWVEDYGIDSDFVKVRVRGMFPSASAKQFISVEDVDRALGKHLRTDQYSFAPVILSCDPAWTGDDELVIGKRQGLAFTILRVIAKNDNDFEIATLIAQLEDEHKADAVFIDGGFGTGIYSAGQTMGRDWQLVWFNSKSTNAGCINKRAEMWLSIREWLKAGGAIPDDKVLYSDLIGPETIFRKDGKIQLESKEDMRRRGQPSPGRGDALGLTFAFPVTKKRLMFNRHVGEPLDYDPLAEIHNSLTQPKREYDPLAHINRQEG